MLYDHFQFIVDALRRAGASLTQDSFVKALETTPYAGEGLGPQIRFSPTKRYSSDSTFLGQVDLKIKDFQRVTPWITPPPDLTEKILK